MILPNIIFNTKYSKYPMFLQYVKDTHKVSGNDYLAVRQLLQPADVILRGHDNYLSKFVIPGKFSHAAIYIGDERIIHATLEHGVHISTLVDFMRCDRFAALRLKNTSDELQSNIMQAASALIGASYDPMLVHGNNEFYCFELVASVFKNVCHNISINKVNASTLWGLIKKDVFCADSFLKSENFICVCEIDHASQDKQHEIATQS